MKANVMILTPSFCYPPTILYIYSVIKLVRICLYIYNTVIKWSEFVVSIWALQILTNYRIYSGFYVTDKHCDAPDFDAVLHGNISSISPLPDQPNMYGYKTKLVYSCQVGYEFPGGETDIESYCLQSNTWSKIDKNCSSKNKTPLLFLGKHLSKGQTIFNIVQKIQFL
jgi:hypothetical protein